MGSLSLSATLAAGRGFLRRTYKQESERLFTLALILGALSGLLAVAFHLAISQGERLFIDRAMKAPGSQWILWTILTPTVGGIVAGILLSKVVPGARGSGIPDVKRAYILGDGSIKLRDAIGKFFIGAFQIATGASLGREGPTVHICAGAASLVARGAALTPATARRLNPVGAAAGIAAAFNAPIAAVTFTIEEIVGRLDHTVLSGIVVAAALAAVIERGIFGVQPVIAVHHIYGLDHASSLPMYAVLGVTSALVSVGFSEGILKLRLWFRSLKRVPQWAQPAIGGLVTGILAVVVLWQLRTSGVTGGGYQTLTDALDGKLAFQALGALLCAKLIATIFSYASGGCGGLFAPSLFIGGMLGGVVGYADAAAFGHSVSQVGAFTLVGMGAVFAGVIRAPITSVFIIFEMTGSYGLVLPLMLANASSYVIAKRIRPRQIYEALLEQDGVQLPDPNAVTGMQVLARDVMSPPATIQGLDATIADARKLAPSDGSGYLAVIDKDRRLLGALPHERIAAVKGELSIRPFVEAHPRVRGEEPLSQAMAQMSRAGKRQFFVVERDGQTLSGVVTVGDVLRAHTRGLKTLSGSEEASPTLSVRRLMLTVATAEASEPVLVLATRIEDRSVGGFVLPTSGSTEFHAILASYIEDAMRDDALREMLIAADVARPAARVSDSATNGDLLVAFASGRAEAVVVVDASGQPIGLIGRSAFAEAMLDTYGTQSLPPTPQPL